MEAKRSSEKSVYTYQATRRHLLEYSSLLIRPSIRSATVGYMLSCSEFKPGKYPRNMYINQQDAQIFL